MMFPLLAEDATLAAQVQGHAVGWGTLSLINAGLAQSKNRSGLLWWLGSLFFGPLATFLIVVLPRVEEATEGPADTARRGD